jgi:hypothetical protein
MTFPEGLEAGVFLLDRRYRPAATSSTFAGGNCLIVSSVISAEAIPKNKRTPDGKRSHHKGSSSFTPGAYKKAQYRVSY